MRRSAGTLSAVAAAAAVLGSSAGAVEKSFRARFGGNISWLTDDATVEYGESAGGLYFTGLVGFQVSEAVTIETGAGLSRKGGTGALIDQWDRGKDVLFLEVPVHARMPISGDRAYALAGVTLGFTLSAKTWIKRPGRRREYTDARDQIEDAELALAFGVGCRLGDEDEWSFEVVYSHGLTDLDRGATSFETRTVSLALGYAF